MSILSAHTKASTAYTMLETKSQPMMDKVATFPARQCQGSGSSRDKAEMIAMGPNSGCIANRCSKIRRMSERTQLEVFEASFL